MKAQCNQSGSGGRGETGRCAITCTLSSQVNTVSPTPAPKPAGCTTNDCAATPGCPLPWLCYTHLGSYSHCPAHARPHIGGLYYWYVNPLLAAPLWSYAPGTHSPRLAPVMPSAKNAAASSSDPNTDRMSGIRDWDSAGRGPHGNEST